MICYTQILLFHPSITHQANLQQFVSAQKRQWKKPVYSEMLAATYNATLRKHWCKTNGRTDIRKMQALNNAKRNPASHLSGHYFSKQQHKSKE